jgi:hypothetical protein
MAGSFGGALGAVLVGYYLDRGEVITLFLTLAASYALGVVFWLGVNTARTLSEPPGPEEEV